MSDKKNSAPSATKTRKIKFLRRTVEAESTLDFSFQRKDGIYDFLLEEGKIYELPEDVIQHINSLKKTFVRSNAHTQEIITYDVNYYYCEPVVD